MRHVMATTRFGHVLSIEEREFGSIKEAAKWLVATGQAVTNGKPAAFQTVRTNIAKSIRQPHIYPQMYGYSWREIERSA